MNSDAGAGALEQFTILAKSTKGNGCAALIQQVRELLGEGRGREEGRRRGGWRGRTRRARKQ